LFTTAYLNSASQAHRQTKRDAPPGGAYIAAMGSHAISAPLDTAGTASKAAREIHLIAGPPPANPPLLVAVMLVALGITAPFLFLQAGGPSVLLGLAVLALAGAGIIAMSGAVAAQLRRRADAAIRPRASISGDGITFHAGALSGIEQNFPAGQIHSARLLPGAIVIQTAKDHPKPGRHVLRFSTLATPRAELEAALTAFNPKP